MKDKSKKTHRISHNMTFESKLPLTTTFPPPSFAPAPPPAYRTTLIFPKCPCRRRVMVPDATSQMRTALSPPHEANEALSGALVRAKGAQNEWETSGKQDQQSRGGKGIERTCLIRALHTHGPCTPSPPSPLLGSIDGSNGPLRPRDSISMFGCYSVRR
jgi:hypothetical protein